MNKCNPFAVRAYKCQQSRWIRHPWQLAVFFSWVLSGRSEDDEEEGARFKTITRHRGETVAEEEGEEAEEKEGS